MGINRIVVTSGRVRAKMGFHIDASDTGRAETASQFDFQHDNDGGAAGSASAAASQTHQRRLRQLEPEAERGRDQRERDLTGEVDLKFKSETFPLERFADTGAIIQIQGNTPNPTANKPVTGSGPAKQSEAAS